MRLTWQPEAAPSWFLHYMNVSWFKTESCCGESIGIQIYSQKLHRYHAFGYSQRSSQVMDMTSPTFEDIMYLQMDGERGRMMNKEMYRIKAFMIV